MSEAYETPKNLKHLLFSFHGRLNRGRYWGCLVFNALINISFVLFSIAFYPGNKTMSDVFLFLAVVYSLFSIWPIFAVQVKRCHDMGITGAFSLISLLLFIWPFVLGFPKSFEGENKYGKPV